MAKKHRNKRASKALGIAGTGAAGDNVHRVRDRLLKIEAIAGLLAIENDREHDRTPAAETIAELAMAALEPLDAIGRYVDSIDKMNEPEPEAANG
jgi:hypothetical protein